MSSFGVFNRFRVQISTFLGHIRNGELVPNTCDFQNETFLTIFFQHISTSMFDFINFYEFIRIFGFVSKKTLFLTLTYFTQSIMRNK